MCDNGLGVSVTVFLSDSILLFCTVRSDWIYFPTPTRHPHPPPAPPWRPAWLCIEEDPSAGDAWSMVPEKGVIGSLSLGQNTSLGGGGGVPLSPPNTSRTAKDASTGEMACSWKAAQEATHTARALG